MLLACVFGGPALFIGKARDQRPFAGPRPAPCPLIQAANNPLNRTIKAIRNPFGKK